MDMMSLWTYEIELSFPQSFALIIRSDRAKHHSFDMKYSAIIGSWIMTEILDYNGV